MVPVHEKAFSTAAAPQAALQEEPVPETPSLNDVSITAFVSPTFLVPKPDGTSRFILNLKKINEFIHPGVHFKLEDGRTVCRLLFQNCSMATLDLKNACYSISIYNNHRKYLRFYCNGQLYEFKCLSFGLCTAPYVFTKTMKSVVSSLRKKGITIVIYHISMTFFS